MSANNRKNTVGNITLSKFDALFGSPDEPEKQESAPTDGVQEIPLEELHEFQGHPFRVRPDEELAELVESIRQNGVLVPGMARKRAGGGYEIIAGHTRKRACEIAGLKTMPMFVKDANDDEACLMMVDSNKIGVNINQIAKKYNENRYVEPSAELLRELKEVEMVLLEICRVCAGSRQGGRKCR